MCTTVRRWKEFYRREVNLWLDGSAVRCRSLLGTQETSVHAPVTGPFVVFVVIDLYSCSYVEIKGFLRT
jgi:hypothetical protein